MLMTTSQTAGSTTRPAPRLAQRERLAEYENSRAVEQIEAAERTSPHCYCGSHMLAVAHGDAVWLECASHDLPRTGIRGLMARLTALGHTRRMILELPAD
jgi:hypothetical protein